MVADWEMKPGELVVAFLEPVEQTARFVITGETRTPRDGQIDIPVLRLADAERETGGLAVEVLGAGEIKDRKSGGLENADAADLGEMVYSRQSQSLVSFRFRTGDSKAARSLTVNVARYTQESVLVANIEEARYNILISGEGKTLVQARYAIRNNQRNFLKITPPAGAIVWSASLSGKPVRPGISPDGSLLLPLEKARAGEEAPAFAAELLFLARGAAWSEKGKVRLALPALDLPVSRTGILFYLPPLFRVIPEPGSFRTQTYQDTSSPALVPGKEKSESGEIKSGTLGTAAPAAAKKDAPESAAQAATQALVEKFRNESLAGRRSGILPIRISFPAFGPSIYLVSELTAENLAASVDFSYQRERKGGAR
jgi:hypothetical protein